MGVRAGYVSGQVVPGGGAQDWRPQFRLRPGQDDALIAWLCSMAPRRRSQAIREALHQYVASYQEAAAGEWDEDPDLAAALDALF